MNLLHPDHAMVQDGTSSTPRQYITTGEKGKERDRVIASTRRVYYQVIASVFDNSPDPWYNFILQTLFHRIKQRAPGSFWNRA